MHPKKWEISEYTYLDEDIVKHHHDELTPFVCKQVGWECFNPEALSLQALSEKFGEITVNAFATLTDNRSRTFTLKEYIKYSQTDPVDEHIYYLHWQLDNKLFIQINIKPPIILDNWLMKLPESIRPKYRWILIGPKNSGSPIHSDIINSSAWNILIQGVKIWSFFLGKNLEIVSYYRQLPGDLVIVPSTCKHSVLNLTQTVAITENFLNDYNYNYIRTWFSNSKQISWLELIDKLKNKYGGY